MTTSDDAFIISCYYVGSACVTYCYGNLLCFAPDLLCSNLLTLNCLLSTLHYMTYWQCVICNVPFEWQIDLLRHCEEVHGLLNLKFRRMEVADFRRCPVCRVMRGRIRFFHQLGEVMIHYQLRHLRHVGVLSTELSALHAEVYAREE